jgi:uncharacterized membrane protein
LRIKEEPVFEEFQGIPVHPLLVHAAVVFVPLLGLVSLLYALLPFSRQHLRWVLFALSLIGPATATFARLSGLAFFDRMKKAGKINPAGEFVKQVDRHQHFGTMTLYATIALGIVGLLLWWFVRPRAATERAKFDFLSVVLSVVTVVAAGIAVYYVVRTGDSGSKMVWTGQ